LAAWSRLAPQVLQRICTKAWPNMEIVHINHDIDIVIII
jgi:hypothetical protein